MYEVLDIVCVLVLGGWAYVNAKKKRRDEIGWAIVAAAAFYVVGMLMEKALAPKLGLTPGWQKASAYMVGGLAGLIVNLVLLLKPPLAPPEEGKGGPAAGAGTGGTGPTPGGGPPAAPPGQTPPAQALAVAGAALAAPSPAVAAEAREAGGAELEPVPAPAAAGLTVEDFLARFWPSLIVVALYLVTQFEGVTDFLRAKGYDPPYPPVREAALVLLVPAQVWLLRRRVAESAIAALLVLLYIPALNWMEWRWSRGSDYYSHGYIIPLVVAALVWRLRGRLAALEVRGDFRRFGLAVLLGGLLIQLLGTFLRAYSIQGVSLVIVLCGLVFFLCGRAISRLVLFPLLFTVTMVPLPMHLIDGMSFRLKSFATKAAVKTVDLLRSLGLHSYIVIEDGSYIRWEATKPTIEKLRGRLDQMTQDGSAEQHPELAKSLRDVVTTGMDTIIMGDVCSGLRSLIALIAFGALFAYVAKLSLLLRLALFAAAVPISILANMWRVVTLTFIATHWWSGATHGWVHDFTGYGIFAIAFVLFFAFERFLHRFERNPDDAAPPDQQASERAPACA